MNILLINNFCVLFMVSEIQRVSVFGYFQVNRNSRVYTLYTVHCILCRYTVYMYKVYTMVHAL